MYITSDASFGRQNRIGIIEEDKKFIMFANIHRSIVKENVSYYYGLGGSIGSYKFTTPIADESLTTNKEQFYSINTKAGINFHLPLEQVDLRLIGFELTYNYEFGSYQDKLSEIESSCVAEVFNPKSIFAYNISSEYVFKVYKDEVFINIGVYAGGIISKVEGFDKSRRFLGIFGGVTYNKFNLSVISEATLHFQSIESIKLGLTYMIF